MEMNRRQPQHDTVGAESLIDYCTERLDARFSLSRHNSSDESIVLSEPSSGASTASCSTDDDAKLTLLREMPPTPTQDPSLHWEPFAPPIVDTPESALETNPVVDDVESLCPWPRHNCTIQ